MLLLQTLTLGLLAWIPASVCRVTTVSELAVLEGRTVTVPCHYDPQYAGYVKYWCQGRVREVCSSLARTDTPSAAASGDPQVTIFDDPVQQVFTVTMRDVAEAATGWYWCGVEVGSMWTADVAVSLHINVIHGMSVVNSRLSGEEGSSVSVECLYSKRYRASEKKWCRSGDWSSCLVTGSEGHYHDAAVAISDDTTGSFSVTLKELRMRDTGWYWCAAGQQQTAVHVLVTPRPSTTTMVLVTSPPVQTEKMPLPKHVTKDSWDTHRHILESVVVCISILLLLSMALLARKLYNEHKREQRRRQTDELKARLSEHNSNDMMADLQNASVIFLNKDTQRVDMF